MGDRLPGRGRWAVSGPQLPVHAFVVQMAGYAKPWFLVTTALDLSAVQGENTADAAHAQRSTNVTETTKVSTILLADGGVLE
jgi:hypothetical protein